jgi:hypothetical protein
MYGMIVEDAREMFVLPRTVNLARVIYEPDSDSVTTERENRRFRNKMQRYEQTGKTRIGKMSVI